MVYFQNYNSSLEIILLVNLIITIYFNTLTEYFMSTQLFKRNVPNEHLYDLLEKICVKTDKYYLIDLNAYKKLLFYSYFEDFKQLVKPFYNLSKQFYVERKLTYNSFTNIIRQICKNNNIMFTSQIKYNESEYNIDFFIYF